MILARDWHVCWQDFSPVVEGGVFLMMGWSSVVVTLDSGVYIELVVVSMFLYSVCILVPW